MKITNDIFYVGVNDHQVDLFEGQYRVPNGMAYNSYVILDEKVAVLDTVDRNFDAQWLGNIAGALQGRKPDYLVIHHMEPDHAGNIARFTEVYPEATIVSNTKAFAMMEQFFPGQLKAERVIVDNGTTLSLGAHSLIFVTAPMVHWPEVMVSYDPTDKVLFSADAFGKFGALDAEEPWDDEARRYYIGIVGKYGVQAMALLKKAADLDISIICATHGPILRENLGHYIQKYITWASYAVEEEGIVIAYTSIYGNTRKAVELLEEKLRNKGAKVVVYDLARCDMAQAVAETFRYSKLVLATTTYNADVFPHMRSFIEHLTERNFQNRTVAFMENGSWAPRATKVMGEMLSKSKNLTLCDTTVRILSALNADSTAQIESLAEELSK
ncbi:MAG: FprA family A-type flavoprotein [Oscillospiraceae bacterium]|nr:FprA family A-type flavoprotein [Oscillospiraceae bacterium]